MKNFEINCHFKLDRSLIGALGSKLQIIVARKGTFHIGQDSSFSATHDLLFVFYNESKEMHVVLQFISKGYESFAGNLYGCLIREFTENNGTFDELGYNFRIISDFGSTVKIVGLGELRKEIVFVDGKNEEVQPFFPEGTPLPETITIDKRTLEVVGFHFSNGSWLYLFPDREDFFRIEFNSTLSPEELCGRWDYVAMEKDLKVLEVFE